MTMFGLDYFKELQGSIVNLDMWLGGSLKYYCIELVSLSRINYRLCLESVQESIPIVPGSDILLSSLLH